MKFTVGQKVRFIGGMFPNDEYHGDFQQLFEQVGTVIGISGVLFPYRVDFEGFTDSSGDKDFVCSEDELESVE